MPSKKQRAKEKKKEKEEERYGYLKKLAADLASKEMITSFRKGDDLAIEEDKADFGQYGDHTRNRPYNTIGEGIQWYMLHAPHVHDEMYLPCVAKNFGLTVKEARTRLDCELDQTKVYLN